jgi:hypothetical protein
MNLGAVLLAEFKGAGFDFSSDSPGFSAITIIFSAGIRYRCKTHCKRTPYHQEGKAHAGPGRSANQ